MSIVAMWQVELWRPVKECPGYDISSLGRIRSWWKPRKRERNSEWLILQSRADRLGYLSISMHREGRVVTKTIHRLVGKAFVAPVLDHPEINHKNLVKADCRVDNLEWSTRDKNMKHAQESGVLITRSGSEHGCARLNETHVLLIKIALQLGATYKSIAKRYRVSPSTIGWINRGGTWGHVQIGNTNNA